MTYRCRVVQAPINDDADYDYIWENAIHNSLGPFWEFAEKANGTIHFEKSFDHGQDAYGGTELVIDAVFDDQSDLAYFKLNFDIPYNNIIIDDNLESFFVKNG